MTAGPVRIFVSAGEPSGDLHGAGVVEALRRRYPDAVIDAFGGPAMAAAGAAVLFPMEEYSAMGFVEVIESLPAHLRLLRTLRHRLRQNPYDLVLLIDYPGFHLRLAASARQSGARVLYYIPPQLWAWRPGRARRLRGVVDRLAVILPFEEEAFRELAWRRSLWATPWSITRRGRATGSRRGKPLIYRLMPAFSLSFRGAGSWRSGTTGRSFAKPRFSCSRRAAVTV